MLEQNAHGLGSTQFSVLAVIVIYKIHPRESLTFRSLEAAISAHPSQGAFPVLLFDNTPGGCDPGPLPSGIQYEMAGDNAGLAAAYNRALSIAVNQGCNWLLTLDQDTELPVDYLDRVSQLSRSIESQQNIAAIVPRLTDAGRPLSPQTVNALGERFLPINFTGIPEGETRAFNSASFFRVKALQQIGGFSPYFWLDYLDMYVFHQFHLRNMRVYVAGDIEIDHKLSLLHRASLRPDRFRNVLQAESAYHDLYAGRLQGLALVARYVVRMWRQFRRKDSPEIRRVTREEFKKRVFLSRARRLEEWRNEVEERILSSPAVQQPLAHLKQARPTITVCMATYNGAQFIQQQLESILDQLGADDEVVVVDDASSDQTLPIIEGFADPRIRIIRQERNLGVMRTFNRALDEAAGEIIFLADQDDVWRDDKVSKIKAVFAQHADISLVLSDCAIIDGNGNVIAQTRFPSGKFHPGAFQNFVRNQYLGCSMAFRRSILDYCLPFPADTPMHDMWIGIINQLVGKSGFIDEALTFYRRHGRNISPHQQHAPLAQMIRWRWALAKNLARFYARRNALKRRRLPIACP